MASSLRFLANLFHVLGYCVLFFSLYSCKSSVYAARELASHQRDNQKSSLLTAASPCTASTKGLQVAHKNEPCSPVGHENPSPTSREILLHDQLRVRSLHSISAQGDTFILQAISDTSNFGVKVGFGTPKRDLTLMFDTGSRLTWIRCQTCSEPNCTESIFDPSKSSTFSKPMTDDCKSPSPPCNFTVDYADHSHSGGYYASDTITFSPTANFSEFVFGCSQNISGNFSSAAGILGFEAGKYSVMSQTDNTFKQVFCYCIPSAKGSPGYLLYGDQARQACGNHDITVSLDIKDDRYYVKLVGITISGTRLTSADSNSLSHTILDTGTPTGRLTRSVYAELSSLFQEMMSKLHPNATKTTVGSNDVCYNIGGLPFIQVPYMTLLFDDFKELKLDVHAIVFQEVDSLCLAFTPSEDEKTIIGNTQQRNLMINYDILGQQVAFRGGGCTP